MSDEITTINHRLAKLEGKWENVSDLLMQDMAEVGVLQRKLKSLEQIVETNEKHLHIAQKGLVKVIRILQKVKGAVGETLRD